MRIIELTSVTGFIAFDLDCPTSGGGTRLAPDVTRAEATLLARAMTYKLAVLERPFGGAKAVLRAGGADREETIARYCKEIEPLVLRAEFLTASDLGTRTQDFASLPDYDPDSVMHREVDGELADAVITGLGVVTAAEAALGGLAGRSIAVEGFGKIGGVTAREAVARGARLAALSTVHGCVWSAAGLDVPLLFELRARHGDRCVEHLGLPVLPPAALYEAEAEILVPGARTGVLDAKTASGVRARLVAPAANVPYTSAGLRVLRHRGIVALADFVCSAGATIGYLAERDTALDGVPAARELVAATVERLTLASLEHPGGPFAGACAVAESYLRTWREPDGMPEGAPLAPEPAMPVDR